MIYDFKKSAAYYSIGLLLNGPVASLTTSLFYLWSAATNTKTIEIVHISLTSTGASSTSLTNQFQNTRFIFISAENATPGGTIVTASQLDRSDPASSLTGTTGVIRWAPTGAPTRAAAPVWSFQIGNDNNTGTDQFTIYDISSAGKAIILRPSVGEGFEIYATGPASTLTGTHKAAVTVVWREF